MALANAIATRSKLQSARLYVKVVDLNHLPEKVDLISKLGKKSQEIIFEDLPNACYACKKKGHLVKNCTSKSKNHLSSEKEVKKTKVQYKKVWKPKDFHLKEKKKNENSKAPPAVVDNVSKPLLKDGTRTLSETEILNSKKEVNGIQLEPIFPEQRIEDLSDLSKKIVLYQKMEDKWGDLDEMIELEEG